MALTTRQNIRFGNQDWQKVYESFRNADFQSYDYQTLRKAMIDYIKIYYPEDFNDFVESSEYIALIDLIAFLGQSLAYRTDLNARENFIDTAERRDSVLKLAKLISYSPKRNQASSGLLKFVSVQTTENTFDDQGNDITGTVVRWNDSTNSSWYEQFITIINAAFSNNQKFGNPINTTMMNSILTDEYKINTPTSITPVFTFSTSIDGSLFDFEIVSATSSGKEYIYEARPQTNNGFNILYRNDNRGNTSNNTGFFFYFKQGTLRTETFTVNESIPNNIIPVAVNNINNTDVWLVQNSDSGLTDEEWEKTEIVSGQNVIYNNSVSKKIYQVNTRTNDQIDLVFGDGTFGEIPTGTFTVYFRTSSGITYSVTPDDMQNISITIPYVSRNNRVEQLTVIADLQYTVNNALAKESISDIKTRAPQQYYTQNRMITGEDYNIFPYSNFSSISKAKAINRISSGVSRYLNNNDHTGKYSAINIFGEDGVLYKDEFSMLTDRFTWSTRSDINRIIRTQITEFLTSNSLMHFYYEKFTRIPVVNYIWTRESVGTNSSSGHFINESGTKQQVGVNVSGSANFVRVGAILMFVAPTGFYFNSKNELVQYDTTRPLPVGGTDVIYPSVVNIRGNGTEDLQNGIGAIILSQNVPSNAILSFIIPSFNNLLNTDIFSEIFNNIESYREFGIRYSQRKNSWQIVTTENLNTTGEFSLTNQGSNTNQNLDSSWLIRFSITNQVYQVYVRGIKYFFQSIADTKFYFDKNNKNFNYSTNETVKDFIKILKINSRQTNSLAYTNDIVWKIYDQPVEEDGYVDGSKVEITFDDDYENGKPLNPDIFISVVDNTNSLVFFERSDDYGQYSKIVPILTSSVNSIFSTVQQIKNNVNNYEDGQLFYASSDDKVYQLSILNNVRTVFENTNISYKSGRGELFFQYKHNSSDDKSINPNSNNLIDLYLLTNEYDSEYRSWVLSGAIGDQPEPPTSEELRLAYNTLEDYKSISDTIIFNSARFKPLFGDAADPKLRAIFKVVKNKSLNISDNEIKNRVLNLINSFFASEFWDFGETFYFTELSTYVQRNMSPAITSMIIVPSSSTQSFGSLQQISSEPDEILISVASSKNIEVIDSITESQISTGNSTINTIIT
jgi:hypothetical protein